MISVEACFCLGIVMFAKLDFTETIQAIYTIVIHNLQMISNIKHVPKQSMKYHRRGDEGERFIANSTPTQFCDDGDGIDCLILIVN